MAPKNKSYFLSKVILGIAVSILLVGITGFLTFKNTSLLIESIKRKYIPDEKILHARGILSDITISENHIRSYIITQDSNYLDNYYQAIARVDNDIYALSEKSRDDIEWFTITDSIQTLFDNKKDIGDKLIELKSTNRLENVIKKIENKIDKIENNNGADANVKTAQNNSTKKKSFFWNKKEKTDISSNEQKVNKTEENSNAIVQTIKNETFKIKQEEQAQSKFISSIEYQMHYKDTELMKAIIALIEELEILNRKDVESKAQMASNSARKVIYLVTIFCVLASLLLLVLGNMVYQHIKQNNRYKKALRKAKNEAERLAKAKEDFLSSMSHEIRTPMNSIVGFTDQLINTPLNNQQKTQLGIIKNSAEHLLVIINDILDYAKIESGKMQLEHINFMPRDVIEEVCSLLEAQLLSKALLLSINIESTVPQVLKGDPVRLKQVLINLLSNAIKFTDKGYIKINARLHKKSDDLSYVLFSIEDTGIGIPENKINKIFEDFVQADSSITRRFGGTGLGLPITKKIIEQQEGSIYVESKEGKGSTFNFIIPYEKGELEWVENPTEEKNICSEKLKGLKVLAADDEEYNRALIEAILKKHPLSFAIVTNGKELIDEVQKSNYDIIVTDVRMPVQSGIDAVKFIRHELRNAKSKIPVIALTAAASEDDVKKCLSAGMNDYISKPFKESVLIEKILKHTKGIETKNNGIPENAHATTNKKEDEIEIEELMKLADGDYEFLHKMLEAFIQSMQSGLAELKTAAENKNRDKISQYAHKMASPAKHIGFKSLGELLKLIEREAHTYEFAELEKLIKQVENEVLVAINKTSHHIMQFQKNI
jgi:signal transduction histidine kinase/DNA-binding response OmpR family regulator